MRTSVNAGGTLPAGALTSHGTAQMVDAVAADADTGARNVVSLVVALLGASAGLTFFLYVVGALLEFRRLQTLHLPAQEIVPELPHDALLVLAAHALLVPLIL